MEIKILYTDYSTCITDSLLAKYKVMLPQEIIEKSNRYLNWQDRQACLLGKILIWQGLVSFGYAANCLYDVFQDGYGKPYIDSVIHFNLSHSANIVIAAFCSEMIGIDIEQVREINIENFKNILTKNEYAILKNSSRPMEDFYRIWTTKESVLKGVGTGLTDSLALLDTSKREIVSHNSQTWFIKEVKIHKDYICSLAVNMKNPQINVKKAHLWEHSPPNQL